MIVSVSELLRRADEILRDVESGATATVTVGGRPVAQLVPLGTRHWTTWSEIASVFDTPTDSGWDVERREAFTGLHDPFLGEDSLKPTTGDSEEKA